MDAAGEELADRLRALLVVGPEVDERRMFGTRAFLVEGRILVGARPGGVLLIRVPEDDEAELLLHVGASRATMGPRTMSSRWLDIAPEVIEHDSDLLVWLDIARAGAA